MKDLSSLYNQDAEFKSCYLSFILHDFHPKILLMDAKKREWQPYAYDRSDYFEMSDEELKDYIAKIEAEEKELAFSDLHAYLKYIHARLDEILLPDLFDSDMAIYPRSRHFEGILHEEQIAGLAEQLQEWQLPLIAINTQVIAKNLPFFLKVFYSLCQKYDVSNRYIPPEGLTIPNWGDIEHLPDQQETEIPLLPFESSTSEGRFPNDSASFGLENREEVTSQEVNKQTEHIASISAVFPINLNYTVADVALLLKAMKSLGLAEITDEQFASLTTINGKPATAKQLRSAKTDIRRLKSNVSEEFKLLLSEFMERYLTALGVCNENDLKPLLHTLKRILHDKARNV